MSQKLSLIIEGPDNVGKSTLITNLIKHFHKSVVHQLHYSALKFTTTEDTFARSFQMYYDMFEMMSSNQFIIDRSHIGEFVYGPKYRQYNDDHIKALSDLEEHSSLFINRVNNTVIIYLYDDPESLVKRDDGLSISNKIEDILEEITLFSDAISKSNLNSTFIKVSETPEETFSNVLKQLELFGIDVENHKLELIDGN